MFLVEGACLGVEDVAQIAQRILRVGGRWLKRRAAFRPFAGGNPRAIQGFDCSATQGIERRSRDEPRGRGRQIDPFGAVNRVAEFTQVFAQGGQCAFGVLCDFLGVRQVGAGADALVISNVQGEAIRCLLETQMNRDASLG
jgi:hypothetical protein